MYSPYAETLFAMVPNNVFRLQIHTIVVAGFFETHFVMGLINILICGMVAPVLEKTWGRRTLGNFVVFTNVCVYGLVLVWMVLRSIVGGPEYLALPVSGFSAVNAAFAVALQQRYPDKKVIRGTPIKVRHIPTTVICTSFVVWVSGHIDNTEGPLVVFGTFFGWAYLRFFMEDPETGITGDLREEFAFKMLFPNVQPLRGCLKVSSDVVFNACAKSGFFKRAIESNEMLPTVAPQSKVDATPSFAPRPSDPTADRRRALAMAAIDEKLAQLAAEGGGDGQADEPLDLDQDAIDRLAHEFADEHDVLLNKSLN